ncbi:MAG: NAD-dependent epimerase/dehydratase family protein [Anaerolineae bacterium]
MRILVTGGMGEVGRPTVNWLLDRGHEVRVLDLEVDDPIPGAECRAGDITDFEALRGHVADMEGIVHLAAYPHPSMAPGQEMFRVNVGGTFNIFQAAVDANRSGDSRIERVVCASSINALGYNFGITFPENQLRYFPIDEAHPTHTTDPYSYSKRMIEEIGGYFWRREDLPSLFLRFPAVYNLSEPGILADVIEACAEQTPQVMSLAEPQRRTRVQEIIADFERRAGEREWEAQFDLSYPDGAIQFGRSNFWTSLDVRDAAQTIERGLLAGYEGSHAVYVTDDQNFLGIPSRELAAVFFPDVTAWKQPVTGSESLVSIARVQELIGFEPAFPFPRGDRR